MSWLPAVAPFFVGLAIVFVPGLLIAVACRVRGFDALALAPALSVSVIALSAIVAPMVGISWALWVPFACAVVLGLLGFLLSFGLVKLGVFDAPGRRRLSSTIAPSSMTWDVRGQVWFYLAVVLGALLALRNVARAIGDAGWISQTWDNTFHQNAVRYIADHGNGSSLFISSMTAEPGTSGFYPAAWHDIVSLVFMHSGASVAVSTNATVLVVAGVIWPLSVIYLVRSIFAANPLTLLVTAVASASLASFPFSLIFFGVLYPNLLGYSLLPLGLGMLVQLFRMGLVRYVTTVQATYLGIFVALGIALAHPNAIMSLLVLATPIFAGRIILQLVAAFKRQTPWWVALLQTLAISLIFVVLNILWGIVRPPREAGEMWGPSQSQAGALGELFLNQPLKVLPTTEDYPLWVVSILFGAGIFFTLLAKNRLYWMLGSLGVLAYFYIAIRSLDWPDGRYDVVGIWYNDAFRLAALVPLVVLMILAYGVQQMSERIQTLLEAEKNRRLLARLGQPRRVLAGLAAASLLVLGFLMQSAAPLNSYLQASRASYEPTSISQLLTPHEYRVLENIDRLVPEDEGIVVSAFNGGPLAYAVSGREVTAYHTLWHRTENENYIYNNLENAATDPRVCQILDEENWGYFLWFGWDEVNNDGDHAMWYTSFNKLFETEGIIEPVYEAGDAALYKIVACP